MNCYCWKQIYGGGHFRILKVLLEKQDGRSVFPKNTCIIIIFSTPYKRGNRIVLEEGVKG